MRHASGALRGPGLRIVGRCRVVRRHAGHLRVQVRGANREGCRIHPMRQPLFILRMSRL
ncbi:protein of unassigned function [Methylobacterium oryzae CBMB20]|uniref:Protein of unassigned function n=1 Tax=Methylobacterium oryzae CBMB20 TaxID=693986 RepID=A0A089NXM6_9HYPH|nr:protein of unassigned function [Methylobacterium oryzae CBMB20]